MNGPIFVAGASRSGKTLMRALLSSHPRILVSRRTEMWTRFYERFGDLADDENLERCMQAMLERAQIAALAPDLDRLRRDFRRGPRTYPRLFALMHEQYAGRYGKLRWGDQTGGLERMADQIIPAYAGTRFLHMVRDPRDRYVAIAEKRPTRLLTLERSTLHWMRSARLALRNVRRYPESYRVVTYEALVTQGEETAREVCEFLGEEYEPSMLRLESEPRYELQRLASENGSPLSAEYVGCHRDALASWARSFVEIIARSEMRTFGYGKIGSPTMPGTKR
jgi:hypothetical protein